MTSLMNLLVLMIRQAQHARTRSVISTLIFNPVNMGRDSEDDEEGLSAGCGDGSVEEGVLSTEGTRLSVLARRPFDHSKLISHHQGEKKRGRTAVVPSSA
jgi:hypothetical protein